MVEIVSKWADFAKFFGFVGLHSAPRVSDSLPPAHANVHSKTPHVVTVLWLDSNDVVTILSPQY